MITNYMLAMLGVIATTLIKMKRLQELFKVANQPFKLSKFLADDWVSIFLSFVAAAIFCMLMPDILNMRPEFAKYPAALYLMAGGSGSYFLSLFLSKSTKFIKGVIDIKTNIADDEIDKKIEAADQQSDSKTE